MGLKYKSKYKTLGPRAAQLFTDLHELRRSTFTLADVESITGLSPAAARNLAHKLERRHLVTRLKPGLYNVVPFDMGRARKHVDSPYLIAQELTGTKSYFLSHGTAFELHRMVTQPMLTVYTSSTRRVRPQTVGGYAFKFIHITEAQHFGVTTYWIDKERTVMISDIERTIIDGLRHPAFVGGITEVAKGLWMKRESVNVDRLVEYAQRLKVGAVVRRLGFLLEFYQLGDATKLETLRMGLSKTYQRLDPVLPAEGHHLSRWRLQLNVEPEELDTVRYG